jgi:uncharacterized membrane protein (UPF0127 family)
MPMKSPVVLLCAALLFASCRAAPDTDEKAALRLWEGMGSATLRIERPDGGADRLEVRVADEWAERAQGMQFLSAATIRAYPIWFVFPAPTSVGWHMQNVRAPLDIAWVDEDGRVTKVQRMEPEKDGYAADLPARYALEVAAGEAERLGIKRGTRLSVISDGHR